jgi:hypothetical protein
VTGAGPRPSALAERLAGAAEALRRVPEGTLAPVQLAYAFNGFFQARIVAVLLDAETVPARDAYSLTEGWCTRALELLADVIGFQLVRRYCPDQAGGEPLMEQIMTGAQFELFTSSDVEVERISREMITLAAELEHFLLALAKDESVLPELRGAARQLAPLANLIWAHFGGDSGGW